jgi:hypothetical protein
MTSSASLPSAIQSLDQRIEELRRVLLPAAFDPTGTYPSEQATKTIAFRVLAHGEIEYFLEARARDLSTQALAAWRANRTASTTLLAMIAFSRKHKGDPPATLEPPSLNQAKDWALAIELDSRVASAVTGFHHHLKSNNGIKEQNLIGILLPIGIKPGDIENELLAELNSFGSDRGASAHGSVAHVKTIPDPKGEYIRVKGILQRIGKLDTSFAALYEEVNLTSATTIHVSPPPPSAAPIAGAVPVSPSFVSTTPRRQRWWFARLFGRRGIE